MILRQRVWDIMREEFPTISKEATLTDAVKTINAAMKDAPEIPFAVMLRRDGRLLGVLTLGGIVKAVEDQALKEEGVNLGEGGDFEKDFARACAISALEPAQPHLVKDLPVFRPTDPLLVAMEQFRRSKRHSGVVEEGGRVIGLLLLSDIYRELSRDMLKSFHM
jgi:CBS domain-containing protein